MILPADFRPLWWEPEAAGAPALWFVFHGNRLLVSIERDATRLPTHAVSDAIDVDRSSARFVGMLGDVPVWTLRACSVWAAPGRAYESLRALFGRLPDELLAVGGRALQLLEFDRTHRFCGACAAPTALHEGGRARRCAACGEVYYPKVAPAMMVLIKRDTGSTRQLLLARSARFPAGMYSALAGFVEPAESVEQCVHREVIEEVGVRIDNLRYFSSQGWPFPNSLMIAYVADYESGDIVPQSGEIEDARWFALDRLPDLPHRLSIARRLIDSVVAEALPGVERWPRRRGTGPAPGG
jgi:NAD+ diphosphatase